MHEIFISYRVSDSRYPAAAVFDHLRRATGATFVFRDSDSMRPADHYPSTIRTALRRSYAVVAIIGPGWAGGGVPGSRRIDQPGDWVHHELLYAFENGIPVVPVLLDDAPDLDALELPVGLEPLRRVQTLRLGHQNWTPGLDELTTAVRRFLPVPDGGAAVSAPVGPASSSGSPSVVNHIHDGVHATTAHFGPVGAA